MKTTVKNDTRKTEAAYPIYDLGEAITIAEAVRDLGGANAPVAKSLLAQQLQYAETGPSFFQRVAAAKAFGIIEGWGSYSLTETGKQYFAPTVENGKESSAVNFLIHPEAFAILVQKFDGGKLPSNEIIANIIEAEADIPGSKKGIIATCFIRSAQFIGAIDTGGFLRCKALVHAGKRALDAIDSGKVPKRFTLDDAPQDDIGSKQEPITLYLSPDKKRVVKLIAPLAISSSEYQRICNWINATLIVGDEQKDENQ